MVRSSSSETQPARPSRLLGLIGPLASEAIEQFRADWRGHALTLTGIVWGAAAVILLLSLGAGFTQFLDLGFDKTGDRWLMLDGGYTTTAFGGRRPGRAIDFQDEDLALLRAGVSSASAVAAENQYLVSLETPLRTRATVVSAASADLQRIQNHVVARGRYLDSEDERNGRRVVVLGVELASSLFGAIDPLGRTLQMVGTPFEVIGVLERKGFQFFTHMDIHDRMAFVPLVVGRRALGDARSVHHLYLNLWRIEDEPRLREEARAVLWPRHHLSDGDDEAIQISSVPQQTEPIRNIAFALTVMLGCVGTITLAMAGVGVANLMLAIVNERRRELAMRRACGARRADLLLQLVVETTVIVLLGGVLGVALGLALVFTITLLPLPADIPVPRVSTSVVLTTFAVLTATGLSAGLLPARTASRIDPAAALRVS